MWQGIRNRCWVFCILMTVCPPKGWNQAFEDETFRALAAEGMDIMYQQRFDEAQTWFEEMATRYPTHPAPHFLLATNRWWQSYMSTTHAFFPYIEVQLDLGLSKSASLDKVDTHLEYVFFQYMCYALKTRLYTHQRMWWKAANAGRKVLPFLKACMELTEETPEFYFSAGLYHYYAEAYPEEHPYLKPVVALFPDGDAHLGMEEMEQAARIPNFTQIEAQYYLVDIYLFWEKEPSKAIRLSYQLYSKYPENTWFRAEYVRACVLGRRYAQAQVHLDEMIATFEAMKGHDSQHITSEQSCYTSKLMTRIYYYQGRSLYGRGTYKAALTAFDKSLQQAKLSQVQAYFYIPEAYYHKGLCLDELGMREEAQAAYRAAMASEDNDGVVDLAKGCLDQPCVGIGE